MVSLDHNELITNVPDGMMELYIIVALWHHVVSGVFINSVCVGHVRACHPLGTQRAMDSQKTPHTSHRWVSDGVWLFVPDITVKSHYDKVKRNIKVLRPSYLAMVIYMLVRRHLHIDMSNATWKYRHNQNHGWWQQCSKRTTAPVSI